MADILKMVPHKISGQLQYANVRMRNHIALCTVLHGDIRRRVRATRPSMRGRDAVSLAVSLGCDYGEYLGIGFSRVAQILMRTDGDFSATQSAILACAPAELNDSADIVQRLTGRLRYVALRHGGHLAAAAMTDLTTWLRDRPYELWYAIRDAGLTTSVDETVLEALPPSAAFHVLVSSSADSAFKISDRNCERLCECLRRDDVLPFMRTHPSAKLSNDWLRDNLDVWALDEALGMKRDRGDSDSPSADWLGGAMASQDWLLVRNLQAYGHTPSPAWLVENIRYNMYAAMKHRFDEVSPDWIAAHVETEKIYAALKRGGHLRSLSAEWILERVPDKDAVSALVMSGTINGMDREALRAYLPAMSLCRALTSSGKIAGCDLEWLTSNVPKDTLYAAVLNADLIDGLSPDWLATRLPPAHAYFALCRGDRIRSCERAWLVSRFSGMVLYDALVGAGHDTRFDTLDEYAIAYGDDLHDVLHELGELRSHSLTALARHMTEHDVARAAYCRPGLTAQELADALQGYYLGEAILDDDLSFGLDLAWLTENGVVGVQLLEILEDNGCIDDLPADVLVQLFSGAPLVDALELSGSHADLSDDQLLDALREHPEQAQRALHAFGRLDSCSVDSIARAFSAPGDLRALSACVKETSAYRTMDPDDFARYGITKDRSIKTERLA